MQEMFFVRCEQNEACVSEVRYTREQDAMNAAKVLMIKQAQAMNAEAYLSAVEAGTYAGGLVNKGFRKAVADYLRAFFACPEALPVDRDYPFADDPHDYSGEEECDDTFEDFECFCDVGCTVLTCHFGDELMIDSNFVTCPESDCGYFRIKDRHTDFKVVVECRLFERFYVDPATKNANALLVYSCLDGTPRTRSGLRDRIYELFMVEMSEKTVGEQLGVLSELGFPIRHVCRNGSITNEGAKGYYMEECSLKSTPDVDAHRLGTRGYLMLVLITLSRANRALSTSDIIGYISTHFEVCVSKGAVLRHLKLLMSIGWAEVTPDGYLCRADV